MSAPHDYKYLTNAYVEWLGLHPYVVIRPGSAVAGWVSWNATKPLSPGDILSEAVTFEDHTYIRQDDGLSWDRTDA